ncbi:MAG: endonuclease MutS2 [Clostridia bacterium]|nr:endonuclease MutS2 [Clostridia bacterium]
MIDNKVLTTLEFDKICEKVSSFAVLETSKEIIKNQDVLGEFNDAKFLLDKTNEAYNLYVEGVKGVVYFDKINDELELSKKLSTLSPAALLKVARLLRSSRLTSSEILEFSENKPILKNIASRIFFDNYLENEIFSKIVSDEDISDRASDKLYSIRQAIKRINEKIRERLQSYMRAGANKYLQDNIVSMRNGRYVVPVKSEHVGAVKGFIHDRSASGSTFFIEPQEVLDLNNDLRREILAEIAEVERILYELTEKVSTIADNLTENIEYLTEIDVAFAKAEYSYKIKAVYPKLNANGIFDVREGRHPLISKDTVVPISINFGNGYNYVLISGPNTGGKTVTLKLVGLFSLMAMSGIFIPASEGSSISVFNKIFCNIGDEQSIENSLSTFSSHVKNLKQIIENADEKSLVLIDEIGAGTDPEEGACLAQSILEKLIKLKSFGVVTTHYSTLKEFALVSDCIINASMDFDCDTFSPLYKINMGTPGNSNALAISERLGVDKSVIDRARGLMNAEKVQLDKVLAQAEKSRIESENLKKEILEIKEKETILYQNLIKDREKFDKERENFLLKAKTEARKIVNEKLETAEDLLIEMKEIFAKSEYTDSDLVKMSTLKNKLENEKYNLSKNEDTIVPYKQAEISKLKVGDKIFVKTLGDECEIVEINERKNTAWVMAGSLKINAKIGDIYILPTKKKEKKTPTVSIKRDNVLTATTEINVIGKNLDDALLVCEKFIDSAILSNLEEVKIIHGKGLNILSRGIQKMLKSHRGVKSFRFGAYGEGETGVTIVKLK